MSATSLSFFLPHPDELVRIIPALEAVVEPSDLAPLAEICDRTFIYRFYAGIMHENYHRRLPTPPSSNPLAEEIAVAVRLDNGNYVA